MSDRDTLVQILDVARWAPSGDNTQPWRFEIVADDHIAVHGHDSREWSVYDFNGHASQLAHGGLLESLRIAATAHGLRATWSMRPGTPDDAPIYDVHLAPDPTLVDESLVPFITTRTVQRRRMRTTQLGAQQREAIAAAPGEGFWVQFFEPISARMKVTRRLWQGAGIRLNFPEAHRVHMKIIDWDARYSADRVPIEALGVSRSMAKFMRSGVDEPWERVAFFNRYLGGTIMPRIQTDVLPGLFCGAHMLLRSDRPLRSSEDYVAAGAAMQRMWLTVAQHGLHLQPEMMPVIFRWYARAGKSLTTTAGIDGKAADLATRFERLVGAGPDDSLVFFCRVGNSKQPPQSRSVRRDTDELLLHDIRTDEGI